MADEAKQQTWTPIKEAVDDFWTAFLTPPLGHLTSFTEVLMEHDQRFPPNFLADFIEQFRRLHGWNPKEDPNYLILYDYEKEKIKKKERTQRQKMKKKEKEMNQIEHVATPKEIEENVNKMKNKIQVLEDQRVQANKDVIKSNSLGRRVEKYAAYVVNQTKAKGYH